MLRAFAAAATLHQIHPCDMLVVCSVDWFAFMAASFQSAPLASPVVAPGFPLAAGVRSAGYFAVGMVLGLAAVMSSFEKPARVLMSY